MLNRRLICCTKVTVLNKIYAASTNKFENIIIVGVFLCYKFVIEQLTKIAIQVWKRQSWFLLAEYSANNGCKIKKKDRAPDKGALWG